MNDPSKKTSIWRKLLPYSPLILIAAVILMGRNPLSASPGDPPATAKGAVYDLSFSPL